MDNGHFSATGHFSLTACAARQQVYYVTKIDRYFLRAPAILRMSSKPLNIRFMLSFTEPSASIGSHGVICIRDSRNRSGFSSAKPYEPTVFDLSPEKYLVLLTMRLSLCHERELVLISARFFPRRFSI